MHFALQQSSVPILHVNSNTCSTRFFAHTGATTPTYLFKRSFFTVLHTFLTCCTQGFFKGICDVAKVAIIHTKRFSQIWLHTRYEFGKEKKNCSIFLSTYWNSSFKSGDLKTKPFKIWVVYVIFSVRDPLYRLKSYFF
jgi:hypothetical protein